MSLQNKLRSPGKVLTTPIDKHFTRDEQQIREAGELLLEIGDCLKNDEALVNLVFAITELSGPTIGPTNITKMYHEIKALIYFHTTFNGKHLASTVIEQLLQAEELLYIPFLTSQIMLLEQFLEPIKECGKLTGSKDLIPDINLAANTVTGLITSYKRMINHARALQALRKYQAEGIIKLGISPEAL